MGQAQAAAPVSIPSGRLHVRNVVYIAGPISSPHCIQVAENLHRFTQCEHALLQAGCAPIDPGSDWAAVSLGGVDYEALMERDRALLMVSRAVYFMRGWRESPGAVREHRWAARCGILCVEEPPEGFEKSGFVELREALEGT